MSRTQQEPQPSERWISAALIIGFVIVLGGLAFVISNRDAPDDEVEATRTTEVQTTTAPPSTAPPSSAAAPETTTLAPTTAPVTTTTLPTTTLPPTTTTRPTTTVAPPPTTATPKPPSAWRTEADGLYCRDMAAMGYPYRAALAYWKAHGRPSRMDADMNGVPCETVYSAPDVAAGRAQARAAR